MTYKTERHELPGQEKSPSDIAAIVEEWRIHVLALMVSDKTYEAFGREVVEVMTGIMWDIRGYKEDNTEDKIGIKKLRHYADIAEEGCADLYASWREGAAVSDLRDELNDYKKLWLDQLRAQD